MVGLDPRWDSLPTEVRQAVADIVDPLERKAIAFERFCLAVIDVVAPLVPAVKPQAAFFEELGLAGLRTLHRVMGYARARNLLVICDAKRGDIGTTAEAYARAYLAGEDPQAAPWPADALTVNPYMGADTLAPFVETARARNAGLYVLVRTSNPGAGTFQDIGRAAAPRLAGTTGGESGRCVYEAVADVVQGLSREQAQSGGYGSVGAVVGATYPEELKALRARMPSVPLLIPGYGAQGGTGRDLRAAFDAEGLGAVVNNSRGILFAYEKSPYKEQFGETRWQAAVEAATQAMIADLRA